MNFLFHKFTHNFGRLSLAFIAVLFFLLAGVPTSSAVTSPAAGSADLGTGSSDIPILAWAFSQPKPKQGTPVKQVIHTIDGKHLELVVYRSLVRPSAHGLDPLSREGYVSMHVAAKILGGIPGEKVHAKLTVGYSIGYPVSLFPDGVDVTLTTPSVQLTGQVDASINPQITLSPSGGGGSVGQIGGQLGAQVTVIPPQQAQFKVAPGGIKDIDVTDFSLTSQQAEVMFTGGHIALSTALGPVMVRPFAKLSVITSVGVYELELHDTHSSDVSL